MRRPLGKARQGPSALPGIGTSGPQCRPPPSQRHDQCEAHQELEEAEGAKRSSSLPENYESDLLRPFMDALALEVSRALQFFFTSTQFNQVDHIVLAGGCAVIPGLAETVAGRTQVDTLIAARDYEALDRLILDQLMGSSL